MTYDITYFKDNGELSHRRAQTAETLKEALEQTRRYWPYAAVKATLYVGQLLSGHRWETVYKDTLTLSMLHERLSHE